MRVIMLVFLDLERFVLPFQQDTQIDVKGRVVFS